ncbi:MAG TPA: hypothetical protein VFM77_08835, partial [Terriglobales bacterium]|nr:hypothetical protein [Terriglobales bacterium]
HGCDLLARSVDAVGHAELWQRPTDANNGNWSWSKSGKIQEGEGGKCVFVSAHLFQAFSH